MQKAADARSLWFARAMQQMLFWGGAVLVALVAIGFTQAANAAQALFAHVLSVGGRHGFGRLAGFIVSPLGLAAAVLLTRRVFPGAQGSGIPQAIAALEMREARTVSVVLSARLALGKILLTLLGLASGASIGREGPTVQIGASIMHALGRLRGVAQVEMRRALILAGGAAGIAAAFNTPLAGVVFAIEELSHSFEARTSGTTLTAVILAGIASLALVGNYSYFGTTTVTLAFGPGWLAVLLCGVAGGLAGGVFSTILLRAGAGFPGRAGRWVMRHPVGFAALCGLLLAILGWVSGDTTYGTGYEQARQLVEGGAPLPASFPALKFAATIVSYLSGIPGGIFAPSLAIGAGLGQWLAPLLPGAPAAAVVLLGMVGYFAGVVQAPITAAVIVMEMTANQAMTVPLMATALLAYAVSRAVCPTPLYGTLAARLLAAVEHRHET
jgi:H+/Cl- antiporter ClcA